MSDSIIEAIQTYLKDYSELVENAPLWVNHLGTQPVEYTIIPIAGPRILATDIMGNTEREYPFAFQSVESTAADLERLASMGFYEAFADWLESQSEAGDLPSLATGKEATWIEAISSGYLFEQGESDNGIYQIQCRLLYDQDAVVEDQET